MAINFPSPANTNDTYTLSGKTWKFNGNAWELQPLTAGYTGSKGDIGFTGSKGDTGFTGSAGSSAANAGQVIQVVTATDSTTRSTTSDTFVTASNTLSLSITPSSSSNKILLMLSTSISANVYEGRVTIYKNSANLLSGDSGFASQQGFGASNSTMTGVHYLDSPATTSSITYDVRFLTTSNSVTLNYGSVKASLTALEIKG